MSSEHFSEKVSVNINSSTLSSIDLLVDNGYYSNRSDFINQALRDALSRQQSTLDRIIEKSSEKSSTEPWFIGVYGITKRGLQETFDEGTRGAALRGYGVLTIDNDCDTEQLFAVYEIIKVRGKVICSAAVREHYGLK